MYNLDMIIEETEKQMEDLFLDVETDTGETLYNLTQDYQLEFIDVCNNDDKTPKKMLDVYKAYRLYREYYMIAESYVM